MEARAKQAGRWTARQDRDNLILIPPLAEEFSLYGGPDTTERARKWALDGRYLLAGGIPECAHGLYLLSGCPDSTCLSNFPQLDHASIWVPAAVGDEYTSRPFLLSHPYAMDISDDTRAYGKAHGLAVASYPEFGDDWYGHGAIPVRMSLPPDYPVWPIEVKAAVLLATQPVAWPAEEEGVS